MSEKIKSKNYILSLTVMTILMIIFLRSFYWVDNEFGFRRIFSIGLAIFGILFAPVIMVCVPALHRFTDRIFGVCSSIKRYIVNERKRLIILLAGYAAVIFVSYIIEVCMKSIVYHTAFNDVRFYIILAFNTIVYAFYVGRKILAARPEILFLVSVIVIGMTYIAVTPPIVSVSWDDQIHYQRTLTLANAMNGISYTADNKMIAECADNSINKMAYDSASRETYVNELNKLYDEKIIEEYTVPYVGTSCIAYLPAAIGIVLARGMGLSYIHIFLFGKVCNLFMYAFIMYLAIRKIKYGKIIMSVFGMLPLNVFLATSYSYDPWLISFTALGYAYLLSSLHGAVVKKNTVDAWLGIIFIAVGCLVKQVYFPLMFPGFFIVLYNCRKDKDNKNKKLFIRTAVLICLLTLFLVASFALPMIISPASADDVRGGTDVSAVGQIKYVLENPGTFIKNMLGFLKDYLAIESMYYVNDHAYMGIGEHYGIIVVTLFIVAFLDRCGDVKNYKLVRAMGLVSSFAAIIMVVAALYASFTPVGSDTVAGCSPRYIVPTLVPLLYFLPPDGVVVRFNKKMLIALPYLIFILVMLNSLNTMCASLYL